MKYTQAPKWTQPEMDILSANYATKGMKDLLTLLPGRTRFSIASKAREMNLRAGPTVFALRGSPKLLWTEEEIAKLKAIYYTASANELRAAIPTRNMRAIHKQAERWKLKRGRKAIEASRSDAVKYTAKLNRKRNDDEQEPFQTIVIKPAPKRDAHIVFEAIAQRTPLEQAWCGNV